MKVIYDELDPDEFFNYGGVVTVVKIGHTEVPCDLSETEESVAAELTDVKIGDPNLWVNRKNLNYNV